MSAFWDDLASDMEIPEFADVFYAEFHAEWDRMANLEIGGVPCPARLQAPRDWSVTMHEFATGLGHACPDCRAVV